MTDYSRYASDDDYIVSLTTIEEATLEEFESLGDAISIRDEFEGVTGKYPWEKGTDRAVKKWLREWEREGYIAKGQSARWKEFKQLWEAAASDPDSVRKALKASVKKIREDAKAMAPFDPSQDGQPHLNKSIRARARKGRKTDDYVATAEVGVYSTKKYPVAPSIAAWQEYGTKSHDEQPFLEPALDKNELEVIGKFRDVLVDEWKKKLR